MLIASPFGISTNWEIDWEINRLGVLSDLHQSGDRLRDQEIYQEIITNKGLVLMAAPSEIFTDLEIDREIDWEIDKDINWDIDREIDWEIKSLTTIS